MVFAKLATGHKQFDWILKKQQLVGDSAMLRNCATILVLCSLGGIAGAQDEGTKKDQEKLQGTWKIASMVIAGQEVPQEKLKEISFVFKADTMEIVRPGAPDKREFRFVLDPSKKPSHITLTALNGKVDGKENGGIYRFEKDTLQLCLPNASDNARPTEFNSPPGSTFALFTLRKAAKE